MKLQLCLLALVMSTVGRSSGTTSDRFDPALLEEALQPLASQKKPVCDFEMQNYSKSTRSQGPDRKGLIEYAPVLSVILRFAPKGLPLKSLLMITISSLHAEYDIMTLASKNMYKHTAEWVDYAANRLSVACRHVRDLALSETVYVDKSLKALMDLIDKGDRFVPPPPKRPLRTEFASSSTKKLRPSISDASSVRICSFECRCPDCLKPESISSDGEIFPLDNAKGVRAARADSSDDEIGKQAENSTRFVSAKRGGQKKQAEEPEPTEREKVTGDPTPSKDGTARGTEDPGSGPPRFANRRKMPRPAAAAASVKAIKQRPAAAAPVSLKDADTSIEIQERRNPPERTEAYLMIDNKYAVGCTSRRSPQYLTFMQKIKEEMEAGTIAPTKTAAKERFEELLKA